MGGVVSYWAPAEERFWANVIPEPNTGCWLWMGYYDQHGYGGFCANGRKMKAYRYSYELAYGPIAPGARPHDVCVLHSCDNPPCVNPAHLRLGTQAENTADRDRRGRWRPGPPRRGEACPTHKLSAAQVAEIRAAVGVPQKTLASKYGVNPSTISLIRSGRRWIEVADGR